jgi:HEAT repeat protein
MDNTEIAKYIQALKHTNLSVRRDAENALVRIGVPAIPALIDALEEEEWHVRHSAVVVLGNIGHDSVILPLIGALEDDDMDVRRFAGYALHQIGSSTLPALTKALRDKSNPKVRQRVAKVLGSFKDAPVGSALSETLRNKNEMDTVRSESAESLSRIDDVSTVSALIEVLKDNSLAVRTSAVVALNRMGDSDTLPRKILTTSRLTAQEKVNVLEMLRGVDYKPGFTEPYGALRYEFPDTKTLCERVLQEEDTYTDVQKVLDWLEDGA